MLNKKASSRELSQDRLSSFKNLYRSEPKDTHVLLHNTNNLFFDKLAKNAGYKIAGRSLCLLSFILLVIGLLIGLLIHIYVGILISLFLAYAPTWFLISKSKVRSKKFNSEYPPILLSMSSNMKAGLTVYSSLERSIILLPDDSDLKREVKLFLGNISRGVPKEVAVSQFGQTIDLPELELFRRAFSLVIVHGGRFSHTLERLAKVCRDRENLIKSSKVSTASMRMTSNVLLFIAPILLFMLSAKNKDFWNILLNNSTAFSVGFCGFLIIITSVFSLRKMSDFKP